MEDSLPLQPAPRRSPLGALALRAFQAWGVGHAQKRMRASLDGFYVEGLDEVAEALTRGPLIIAPNHVSWWDGLALVLINHALGADAQVLMLARQLKGLPWFRAFGCVPLHAHDKERAEAELRAAAARLDRPGRVLWIFPQGRHVPVDARPLGLRPGVARLAEWSGAPVLPLALRHDHVESPKAVFSARFGAPLSPGPALLSELEQALLEGLAASREAALQKAPAGRALVAPVAESAAPARAMSAMWRLFTGGSRGA
ncbi:MAG: 1-acyl-sn-glycerol-3-phosphate acyltransferase [Alphaproteobacteria bacterium]|nr:1-acyl-sn-glycerol-3-phosphate acyltransferase [Alphaproteobacteria bacterium]